MVRTIRRSPNRIVSLADGTLKYRKNLGNLIWHYLLPSLSDEFELLLRVVPPKPCWVAATTSPGRNLNGYGDLIQSGWKNNERFGYHAEQNHSPPRREGNGVRVKGKQ